MDFYTFLLRKNYAHLRGLNFTYNVNEKPRLALLINLESIVIKLYFLFIYSF